MDIWKAIRTVGRRWYISLIVLNLCAAATASLVASAEATYSSGATMILLPPNVDTEAEQLAADQAVNQDPNAKLSPVNPFLQSGISMAQAVASAANSDRIGDALKAAGVPDVTFLVFEVEGTSILTMNVDSKSADATNAGMAVVLESVRTIVRNLQQEAGAPERVWITSQVLAPPPGAPIESLAAKTKIAMAMVVASFLVVVCAALVFDNLAVRLAKRRQRRSADLPPDSFDRDLDDSDVVDGDSDAAFRRVEAADRHQVPREVEETGGDRDDAVVRPKATAGR